MNTLLDSAYFLLKDCYNNPSKKLLKSLSTTHTLYSYIKGVVSYILDSEEEVILKLKESIGKQGLLVIFKNRLLSDIDTGELSKVEFEFIYNPVIQEGYYTKTGNTLVYTTNNLIYFEFEYEKYRNVPKTELGLEINKIVKKYIKTKDRGVFGSQQCKRDIEDYYNGLLRPSWLQVTPIKRGRSKNIRTTIFIGFCLDYLDLSAILEYGTDAVLYAYRDKISKLKYIGKETIEMWLIIGKGNYHHTYYRNFIKMLFGGETDMKQDSKLELEGVRLQYLQVNEEVKLEDVETQVVQVNEEITVDSIYQIASNIIAFENDNPFDSIKKYRHQTIVSYLSVYFKIYNDNKNLSNLTEFFKNYENNILDLKDNINKGATLLGLADRYNIKLKKLKEFIEFVYPEYNKGVIKEDKPNQVVKIIQPEEHINKIKNSKKEKFSKVLVTKPKYEVDSVEYLPKIEQKAEYLYFLNILGWLLRGKDGPLILPDDYFELNERIIKSFKNGITSRELAQSLDIPITDFHVYWGKVNNNNTFDLNENAKNISNAEVTALSLEEEVEMLKEKVKKLFKNKVLNENNIKQDEVMKNENTLFDYEREIDVLNKRKLEEYEQSLKLKNELTLKESDNIFKEDLDKSYRKFKSKINTELQGVNTCYSSTLKEGKEEIKAIVNNIISLFESTFNKVESPDDCLNALLKMKEELGI